MPVLTNKHYTGKKIRVSKKILMKAIYPTIKANDYNRTFKREIRLKRSKEDNV